MKAMLIIVSACMVAPVAGAFAGAAINTTPLEATGDPLATIPRHDTGLGGAIDVAAYDTPDHYPLVTPRGTVPVEELVFHGRPARYARPAAAAGNHDEAAPGDPTDDALTAPPSDFRASPATNQLVSVATSQASAIQAPLTAVDRSIAAPGGPLLARR